MQVVNCPLPSFPSLDRAAASIRIYMNSCCARKGGKTGRFFFFLSVILALESEALYTLPPSSCLSAS